MSEFEKGCIIGLKELCGENWRITRHMGRSDAAIKDAGINGWTMADFSVMMQDNARSRMSCAAMNCIIDGQTLPWPSRSSDLSPIQRIWDMTGRRLHLLDDGAHFWLNGYVKKQNCHIWGEANPQVYVETPLHLEKRTVWCALWAGGIIGPYFKNDEGHNVTVNGDRYKAMITNFFIPELNNHDVQELWFQQDGATCHTSRATIDLLKDTFGDRLISRFGPVNWLPRSCDLTPQNYFLWGYVKSLVYADKPQTLDHLEDNIRRVIADIRPQMLEKVIENWTSRLDYIRASRGSPMPEIIFKM
ncbi:putative DD41D transposase [Trichonephila clavipes]|nr:putative DD41D transposase [Trichonephila clavipes]